MEITMSDGWDVATYQGIESIHLTDDPDMANRNWILTDFEGNTYTQGWDYCITAAYSESVMY